MYRYRNWRNYRQSNEPQYQYEDYSQEPRYPRNYSNWNPRQNELGHYYRQRNIVRSLSYPMQYQEQPNGGRMTKYDRYGDIMRTRMTNIEDDQQRRFSKEYENRKVNNSYRSKQESSRTYGNEHRSMRQQNRKFEGNYKEGDRKDKNHMNRGTKVEEGQKVQFLERVKENQKN